MACHGTFKLYDTKCKQSRTTGRAEQHQRSGTSSVQRHDGEHHVLVHRVLPVQRLSRGYEAVGVDGELGLPQVVDEGVRDLAKQPRVLVRRTDLARVKAKVAFIVRPTVAIDRYKLHRGQKWCFPVLQMCYLYVYHRTLLTRTVNA